jgi:hypothetical protein
VDSLCTPSHSQGNSHFGRRSLGGLLKLEGFEGSKLNGLWRYLYHWKVLGKCRCLKWARIAHLDIWNTSYGQKKGRESNCQFDSWPEKVRNRPDLLGWRQRATYRWKALDESYNFAWNRTSIRGLLAKLWGSKVVGVSASAISRLPDGSPGREKPFGYRPRGEVQNIL